MLWSYITPCLGTDSADTMIGDSLSNCIIGRGGNDYIIGRGNTPKTNAEFLYGGPGNDVIDGGEGSNLILGDNPQPVYAGSGSGISDIGTGADTIRGRPQRRHYMAFSRRIGQII